MMRGAAQRASGARSHVESTTGKCTTAGDGGDDADGVAVFGGSGLFREVTDVFVVDVDIHEAAQLAVFGEEVLLKIAELRCESAECFSDGAGADFGGVALARVNPERRRNHDFHCHLLRSNRSWNSKSKYVVGASSRGAIARRFKNFTIPQRLKPFLLRSLRHD